MLCTIWDKVYYLAYLMTMIIGPVWCGIKIRGAGINPLHRGDIGIVFWISVENIGDSPMTVSASTLRCCEDVEKEETDCEHMKLVPSERQLLLETEFINLHVIYPTLYPHHRKGSCLVKVSAETAPLSPGEATSSKKSASTSRVDLVADNTSSSLNFVLTQNITFDTRVFLTHVPQILKDYYGLSEVKWKFDQGGYSNPTLETEVCDSPDEDPLDRCLPVDCAIKYSGSRSFFDPESRLCVKVPLCLSNPNKELPTIAYIPNSNTCRDLESPLTVEDLEYFKLGVMDQDSSSSFDMGTQMLRCHKGEEDANSSTCKCHNGWETYSTREDDQEPPLPDIKHDEDIFYIPFHMCTIQNYGEGPPSLVDLESLRKTPEVIPVMVILTMICVIMMFMAAIVLCWLCTRPCCFTWWKIKKTY